ncbi:MAG: hypothetical protein R6V56_06935 [Lentisphaeria bacterium]
MTSPNDREIIRGLAGELAEIGQLPKQQEKVRCWKALNGLKPERPMVWITELPWREVEDKVDALKPRSADESMRNLERRLRRKLFTAKELDVDEVLLPEFHVSMAIEGAGYGVEIKEEQIAQGESNIQSHHFEPAIKDMGDIEKIKMPNVRHNEEKSRHRLTFYEDLFGDILDVKLVGCRQHFFNAWDNLVRWTGVTEALMDLVMRPDYIHALMRRLTDSFLMRMTQLEEQGLLAKPYPLDRVGSGGAGFTHELPREDYNPDHLRTIDQWGGATPQIFSEVSPEMHEEFALQYENEVMSRCGLNYYGCCEPLHNKMELMAKVPRLRKISISPWCDVAKTAENASEKYVFSHKPTPAIMAEETYNPERAEKDIRERLQKSGDMPCEFILKDISTIGGDIQRVIDWCRMATRVVKE